jgi:hypothetical protein
VHEEGLCKVTFVVLYGINYVMLDVIEFGMDSVWLEGNVIGEMEMYTEARCMKRVCVRLHLWCWVWGVCDWMWVCWPVRR